MHNHAKRAVLPDRGTTGITNEISQNSSRLSRATDSSDVTDVKLNDVVGLSANCNLKFNLSHFLFYCVYYCRLYRTLRRAELFRSDD
jgi:hypothetical protein